jgi:hypothetical protein
METKDVGRLFAVRGPMSRQARKAVLFFQPTFELDPPYRYSNSLVVRLPRGNAFMVGWWRKSPASSLQEHFTLALSLKLKGIPVQVTGAYQLGEMEDAIGRVSHDPEYWDNLTDEELAAYIAEIPKLSRTQGSLGELLDTEAF